MSNLKIDETELRDDLSAEDRVELDRLVANAAVLIDEDGENPEYTRGMAELIMLRMGWSCERIDGIVRWIREAKADVRPRFLGYRTYENEDAIVLSEAEYQERGIPEDWAEYVWVEAADKAEAYARYDDAMAEYEDDNKAGRPIKNYY